MSPTDRLCGGSLTSLLTQLVDGATLTADDVAALRARVDDLAVNLDTEDAS